MAEAVQKPTYNLTINLDQLELNAQEQVEMIGRATRMTAHLKRKHAEAKNAQELVEARLKRAIRTTPSKFGVPDGKITEGSVNEAMVVHDDYQAALKAVVDAKYQLDLMEGIVTALEHRKRMIETEVELWESSYFAKPTVIAGSMASSTLPRDSIVTANKRQIRSKGRK